MSQTSALTANQQFDVKLISFHASGSEALSVSLSRPLSVNSRINNDLHTNDLTALFKRAAQSLYRDGE